MPYPRERLHAARLYLVCDEQPGSFLRAVIRGGVDIVQLRMKGRRDEEILEVAHRFRTVCAENGALFILNDRPDLVSAAGADGVHVGQDDLPVQRARAAIGSDRILGLSTHAPRQIDQALHTPVDYIGVGPVNATPTKPGRPAVGLELVRYAAEHATVPFFAIGGIDPGNVGAVVAAGAERVAVVRALTLAGDPVAVAHRLRDALRESGRLGVGAA
jgi:thiamine-phosphate pyrophosphorylase